MQDKGHFNVGIDIGSTTIKTVICRVDGTVEFSRYRRHHALIKDTLCAMLEEAFAQLGDIEMDLAFTGSAGMGIAENYGFPFLQEVLASSKLINKRWPEVKTFIEIGGEDSKVVFLDERARPDMRMNGICAGGTGAFIDQMATLLNVTIQEFGALAAQSSSIHPIASRCGVFAKTDIQSLLSNHVPKADIAASVFHAVALQVAATLFRGRTIEKKVLFAGGPLAFFPELRQAFIKVLRLDESIDLVHSAYPELIAAMGAALCHGEAGKLVSIQECLRILGRSTSAAVKTDELPPLFTSRAEFAAWDARHRRHVVPKAELTGIHGKVCFLGIDSGSTTTKLVLMDSCNRVVLEHYGANNGDPVQAARAGLKAMEEKIRLSGVSVRVSRTAVTGYGEDLIKAAFGMDDGVVETMAHFRAAQVFTPDVSFILDIGGQDMKAIFIADKAVSNIQINEACSSGCGSFIETFARSLNCDIEHFAALACDCEAPFDLGTRCTVFMNSKIKQAQREGASIAGISAGLAYAVIKNTLYKVLKLTDTKVLGDHIVVQGGTFRNPAVLRAFELLTGQEVVRPDMAQLMGAYGAAITARDNYQEKPMERSSFVGFETGMAHQAEVQDMITCKGCENTCRITRLLFPGGRSYFTGNRCETHFGSSGRSGKKGSNLVAAKTKLLFERPSSPAGKPILTFGIPRALNMYEDFPFWSAYLRTCGFKVVLSAPSSSALLEKGIQSVMSDNICFPGKLVHGHIIDLIEQGVDRIFYPTVVFEHKEFAEACNSFNCPVVTGYPDVIKSAINPQTLHGIPLDSPVISFKNPELLEKQLYRFIKTFGVKRMQAAKAFRQARAAQVHFKAEIQRLGHERIAQAAINQEPVVVLCGRPYHIDPLINHGIPELLAGMGVHVITEDALTLDTHTTLKQTGVVSQWAYPNRIMAVAEHVSKQPNLSMVQLTSFGCGVDAVLFSEIRALLEKAGQSHTLIKIDEITNLGAVKIRLRSLLEATPSTGQQAPETRASALKERKKPFKPGKYIIPWSSDLYAPLLEQMLIGYGFEPVAMGQQDRASVEIGLTYVNNDVCYPAAILIGDIIKTLQLGRCVPEETTIIWPQTFGQCRASNYLPLLQKALAAAGFENVKVMSLSATDGDLQFDLPINRGDLVRKLFMGQIFADALVRLYYATAAREITKGQAAGLHQKYLGIIVQQATRGRFEPMLQTLKAAVAEFNAVETKSHNLPVVGIVGEVFVKYNAFANNNIVEWLWSQDVEVVIPAFLGFFTQCFVNERFDQGAIMKSSIKDRILYDLLDRYVNRLTRKVEAVMVSFRYNRKPHDHKKLALEASKTVSLANQAGEGWLLTAEMIAMLQNGIDDIVCMQPFGCLANHITGKGVSRALAERYPQANLLFLDLDAGHSEVNILNRLQCMVMSAKEERMRVG